jgi:hypothetical protein
VPFGDATERAVEPGKRFVVCFVIKDYQDKSLTSLANPLYDAEAICDTLVAKYGFERPDVHRNPDLGTIYNVIRGYQSRDYGPGDQLLVFISGHGRFDRDIGDGFLLPQDWNSSALPGGDNSLQLGVLRMMLNKLPCHHIFVIIDTCYSGAFDARVAQAVFKEAANTEGSTVSGGELLRRKLAYKCTRKFLSAGRLTTVSDGEPGRHSPFVRRLLDVMNRYADEGKTLTSLRLASELEANREEAYFGYFGDDEPGSDFVLLPLQHD